jgi:hypothetical protein
MLELEVILDFACCECGDSMGVTVKCAGNGLGVSKTEAVSVKVPCPGCQGINQVIFTPEDGTLIQVLAADKPRYMIPEPSLN